MREKLNVIRRCLIGVAICLIIIFLASALIGLVQESNRQKREAKKVPLICSVMQDGSCFIAFPQNVSNWMEVSEMQERILREAHVFFGKNAILGAVPAKLEGASGYTMRVYLKNEEGAAEALGNH